MTYFEYIMQFEGANCPFGDLAGDMKYYRDEVEDIDSFEDFYQHFKFYAASEDCMNTFIQSWAAYLKHEDSGIHVDPLRWVLIRKLEQMTDYISEIGKQLEEHNSGMDSINETLADIYNNFVDVTDTTVQGRSGVYITGMFNTSTTRREE